MTNNATDNALLTIFISSDFRIASSIMPTGRLGNSTRNLSYMLSSIRQRRSKCVSTEISIWYKTFRTHANPIRDTPCKFTCHSKLITPVTHKTTMTTKLLTLSEMFDDTDDELFHRILNDKTQTLQSFTYRTNPTLSTIYEHHTINKLTTSIIKLKNRDFLRRMLYKNCYWTCKYLDIFYLSYFMI